MYLFECLILPALLCLLKIRIIFSLFLAGVPALSQICRLGILLMSVAHPRPWILPSSAARIDLVILASLPSLGQALQPPFGAVPVASELSWACVDALGVAPVLSLGEEASAAEADGPGLGLDSLIALTLLLEWGKGGYAV